MLVVYVRMGMGDRFVNMFMLMALGQVQPNPHCHECTGNDELSRDRLTERDDCGDAAEKGRGREVSTSPRGAEMSQRDDEQG